MDLVTYGRFAVALAVVIGLIAGFAWLMRKYGQGRLNPGGKRGRIGIVEVTGLDTRRRLVLVRRDDVEHLLILGPTGETVVERGILRGPKAIAEQSGGSGVSVARQSPSPRTAQSAPTEVTS